MMRPKIQVSLVCLALLGASPPSLALAQGLPAPGPGGPMFPPADGGAMGASIFVAVVLLLGALTLAVAVTDLRRKRRVRAIAIEGRVSDALMQEPRLVGTVLTAVAQVPVVGRPVPTVEVRGQVEYPDLRELAMRIARQELLRHHAEGRVEDRIFVSPPVPAGRS